MRSSVIFWYYLTIILIVFAAFAIGDFSQTNNVSRWLILILTTLLLLAPIFFLKTVRCESAGHVAVVAAAAGNQLAEALRLNQQLEEQARATAAKDLELTLANQRLEKLEQSKSQFVSVTAHQLRTPLSAIKWTFHMALKGELGAITDEQKLFLQKGYDSTERVITIVNDLLNIDHIETGRNDFTFIPVNIVEWMENIISEFHPHAMEKHVKLELIKPLTTLSPIMIDPIKMSMVLENLIDNAIKYTPTGGQVRVELKDDKINSARPLLEIVVSDSGIGIPAADQEKIFQRFFRSSNAVKHVPDGSGLGLFVAKEIVGRHGGEIWFESKENAGTHFHITIPLQRTKV